jgi:hypothetical protein
MLLELWYWEEYNLHIVFQGAPGYGVAHLYHSYHQVASDARAAAPVGWSNVPVARYPLDTVPVQISRFRAGDSVDVMITARLPLRALARHGKSTTADVDVGLFVTGSRGTYLERDSSRSRLSPADDDAIELRSWRTRLSPGTVEYRVEGLEVSSLRGARAAGTLPIVRKRGLATSDLMIADAITQIPRRATARWTDYLITPNTGEIERSKPVTLLWENTV